MFSERPQRGAQEWRRVACRKKQSKIRTVSFQVKKLVEHPDGGSNFWRSSLGDELWTLGLIRNLLWIVEIPTYILNLRKARILLMTPRTSSFFSTANWRFRARVITEFLSDVFNPGSTFRCRHNSWMFSSSTLSTRSSKQTFLGIVFHADSKIALFCDVISWRCQRFSTFFFVFSRYLSRRPPMITHHHNKCVRTQIGSYWSSWGQLSFDV